MTTLSKSTLHVCSFNVSCMACQMTAGRCHTLLSPVTEESGEEGTNSEVSSPPVCRSPSPITYTEATVTKVSASSIPIDSFLKKFFLPCPCVFQLNCMYSVFLGFYQLSLSLYIFNDHCFFCNHLTNLTKQL